jgi:hypothetical protein
MFTLSNPSTGSEPNVLFDVKRNLLSNFRYFGHYCTFGGPEEHICNQTHMHHGNSVPRVNFISFLVPRCIRFTLNNVDSGTWRHFSAQSFELIIRRRALTEIRILFLPECLDYGAHTKNYMLSVDANDGDCNGNVVVTEQTH